MSERFLNFVPKRSLPLTFSTMSSQTKTQQPRILGIDPAPSKDTRLYDGGDRVYRYTPKCLKKRLEEERAEHEQLLICWDAPLIEWNDADIAEGCDAKGSDFDGLYTRPIDKCFSSKELFPQNGKEKTKKGVSVLGYAGCPHWTITKYCLGLPKIGTMDRSETPFSLLTDEAERGKESHEIVEVHPAVALYYWNGKDLPKYKGSKKETDIDALWQQLTENAPQRFAGIPEPADDDELDAIAAYLLGRDWLKGNAQLLGDRSKGAMLMPSDPELAKKYEEFFTS